MVNDVRGFNNRSQIIVLMVMGLGSLIVFGYIFYKTFMFAKDLTKKIKELEDFTSKLTSTKNFKAKEVAIKEAMETDLFMKFVKIRDEKQKKYAHKSQNEQN